MHWIRKYFVKNAGYALISIVLDVWVPHDFCEKLVNEDSKFVLLPSFKVWKNKNFTLTKK